MDDYLFFDLKMFCVRFGYVGGGGGGGGVGVGVGVGGVGGLGGGRS